MKFLLLLFLLLLNSLCYCQTNPPGRIYFDEDSIKEKREVVNKRIIGTIFPEFEIKNERKVLTSALLKGRVIYFNFWFSKCPPCIAEMETLNDLFEKYKDSGFEFVSLTFESPGEIEKIKQKYNIKYEIYSISPSECRRLNFHNPYPTSIIVDKNSIVKFVDFGGDTNKRKIRKYLRSKLIPIIDQAL